MSLTKRGEIYHYEFRHRGVRFRGSTGEKSRRKAGLAEAAEREKARQQVSAAHAQRAAPMTVTVAFDRFWVEVGEPTYSGTYQATVFASLAWMTRFFGANTPLRDLGPNRITEAIARRRGEGVKNSTVNRTVTELLRTVLRRGRLNWEQTALPEIKWKDLILPEPRERVRELRAEEEGRLVGAMRADYLPAIRFAIISGLRKRELVTLRWPDIDWAARTITIRGKGDKIATIPLTRAMIAILAPLRGHHPVSVFTYVARKCRDGRRKGRRSPITYSGLGSTWRRYGPKEAEIEDFRFHDNRHTAGTRLLRHSGNLKLVQKLLRHEWIATTTKYAHADDHDLRRAMEAAENPHKEYPHEESGEDVISGKSKA